jgi:uncharacterized protein YlxW (UPF0749 family)
MWEMAAPDTDLPWARMRRPPPAREAARTRRPDASMTLLVEVMKHPLDPGYAAAVDRRGEGRRPLRPLSALTTLLVAVACGWVTATAVAELRRPQPEVILARAALEKEIEGRTAAVDRLQRTNERLRAEIEVAQQAALAGGGSTALAARSRSLAVLTGELPVTGSGLELTLDDAPGDGDQAAGVNPRATGDAEQGRVMDRDLQIVVNGLWAAGAEAISINGERLTALSAIRSAGRAILVDFRPLSPPYVIVAIGDPKALQSGFSEDMAGEYVKSLSNNYGVRAGMAARDSVTLPGAGSLALRYASVTPSDSRGQTGDSLPSSTGSKGLSTIVSPSSASPGGHEATPTQEVFP